MRHLAVFPWSFARQHGTERSSARTDSIAPELREIATLDAAAVLRRLGTSEQGLSAAEVERSRQEHGENRVAHEKRTGFVAQLFRRLLNPLVILLIALAAVSIVMRDTESAIIILLMVFLSISLALIQERRSGKAAEKLRAMVHTTAAVIRVEEASGGAAAGWDALHDLMDRAVDEEEVAAIRRTLTETPGIQGAHDIRTRKMGDMVVVDVHLEIDASLTVEAGHKIAVEARRRVLQRHRVLNVMTHVDPWRRAAEPQAIVSSET